jgi:hypothetical protein
VKKIVPILLIVVLLFNVLGYYGLFLGLRLKTTQDLIQRLDDDRYSEAETFTLRLPMAIPYQSGQDEYQRVDGEIEHNGEYFRLVKQKLANDTLYIVCLKDTKSGRVRQALNDYVKTFSDKPVDAKHQLKSFTGFIKDYLPTSFAVRSLTAGWSLPWIVLSWTDDPLQDPAVSVVSPPPEA